MSNKALLLAGGFGSRIKKRAKNSPKCLLKVGDKPIICYLVDSLIKAGIVDIIISTRKEYFCIIKKALNKYKKTKIKIIANSAHKKSVIQALAKVPKLTPLKEPFILLLSDIFYLDHPFSNLKFDQKGDILYGAKPNYLLNIKNEGIIKNNKNGLITHIIKRTKIPSKCLRWSGMAICGTSFWNDLSNYLKNHPSPIKDLESIFQNRINQKRRLYVMKSPNFININWPKDLFLANLINNLWIHKNIEN